MLLPVGRSGWAIAAGYLGLISVLCIPSPFALLAGILAVREMRRNPKKRGMGRAVFGIVMGGIGTIALVIIGVAWSAQALTSK
jgi:predicted acyltransferase